MDIRNLTQWFESEARPLPWRNPGAGPWGVLVSEVMLQQTPVARVLPLWEEWMGRWPNPCEMAAATQAQVVSAWGRLGYPRRAMRLHQSARIICERHQGVVPHDLDELLSLPGIGDYTARAIRTFAYGIPDSVVDTNVRRVVARASLGQGEAGPPRIRSDREAVTAVLSDLDESDHVLASKALMELGALVCTAQSPSCERCPLAQSCAWRNAGYPPYSGPKAPIQGTFEGSDRQVRGIIMRELRSSDIPVPFDFLETLWSDKKQFERAARSLLEDGLVTKHPEGLALAT